MTTSPEGEQKTPTFGELLRSPVLLLAFGFGSGLVPKAPGTAGTLVGVALYLLMQPLSLPVYLTVLLVVAGGGILICSLASERLGVHDHSGIVLDEIAGYLLTMMFASPGWGAVIVGFLLFRVFDILKPWPVIWLDCNVKGGMGIMLDDLAAGVGAGGLLVLLQLTGVI
jgi:phosphatidylglycerophosphatase A